MLGWQTPLTDTPRLTVCHSFKVDGLRQDALWLIKHFYQLWNIARPPAVIWSQIWVLATYSHKWLVASNNHVITIHSLFHTTSAVTKRWREKDFSTWKLGRYRTDGEKDFNFMAKSFSPCFSVPSPLCSLFEMKDSLSNLCDCLITTAGGPGIVVIEQSSHIHDSAAFLNNWDSDPNYGH